MSVSRGICPWSAYRLVLRAAHRALYQKESFATSHAYTKRIRGSHHDYAGRIRSERPSCRGQHKVRAVESTQLTGYSLDGLFAQKQGDASKPEPAQVCEEPPKIDGRRYPEVLQHSYITTNPSQLQPIMEARQQQEGRMGLVLTRQDLCRVILQDTYHEFF